MTAEEFNAKYPIGTCVIYRPDQYEPEGVLTKTRSIAWNLGHGEPVVMVEGKSGGVALWAITIVPIDSAQQRERERLREALKDLLALRPTDDEGRCLDCGVMTVGFSKKQHKEFCKVEKARKLMEEDDAD